MTKLTAILLTFLLIIHSAPGVSAKPRGDWNDVKALVSRPIAVKTKSGVTHFGLLEAADDNAIEVWLAGKDALKQKISLRRDEVAKVWFAKLHIDEANIGKGAWIGAGAGFGAALIAAATVADGGPLHGGGYFVLIGAGAGALLGTQWKKKHKKQGLVYSI
jgi:hypothetical protein